MSLTFKLLSLVIRTAAKPIGNQIKKQAKEHEGFKSIAVSSAQWVHRIDMRMRLGILHDTAAQERMAERERKKEEDKKRMAEMPTVRSEVEQKKWDDEAAREKSEGKAEDKPPRIKIRPLSEAKAIELGANFFSEAFIFSVAVGLLVWDSWRSRAKASDRRDEIRERVDMLEAEVDRLRIKYEPGLEALADKIEKPEKKAWYNPAGWWMRTDPVQQAVEEVRAQPKVQQTPSPVNKAEKETTVVAREDIISKSPAKSKAGSEKTRLNTHDLAIPLSPVPALDPRTSNFKATTHLRLLLLSPSTVSQANLPATIARIQHFSALTGGQDLAIVFLLHSPASNLAQPPTNDTKGIHALATLQAALFSRSEIPHIPILPLASIDRLEHVVQKHAAALTRPKIVAPVRTTGLEMLQLCSTAELGMGRDTTLLATEVFDDLRELAGTCVGVSEMGDESSPSVREFGSSGMGMADGDVDGERLGRMRRLLHGEERRTMLEFWEEEWAVDY